MSLRAEIDVTPASIRAPSHNLRGTSGSYAPAWNSDSGRAVIRSPPTSRAVSSVEELVDYEWTLVEALQADVELRPNRIFFPNSKPNFLIEEMISSRAYGEVFVITICIDLQSASLHFSPMAMKVGASVLDVQLVILENVLREFCVCLKEGSLLHL